MFVDRVIIRLDEQSYFVVVKILATGKLAKIIGPVGIRGGGANPTTWSDDVRPTSAGQFHFYCNP